MQFYARSTNGIKYGELFGTLDELAKQFGWDSFWAFNCYYSDHFLSPGYMTVEKDGMRPGYYLISAETWCDSGTPWFEAPSYGVFGL